MKQKYPIKIQEIRAKTVLSKSRIPNIDYSLNPYVGCEFACRYCYADFMRKYTNHKEKWGEFVDLKMNVAKCLKTELKRNKPGKISISLVTDPYQPVEKQYRLTRQCLEVLLDYDPSYSISILTRSPLVLRDTDLLEQFHNIEVGLSIATDDENIRTIFEPRAYSISSRIETLMRIKSLGINTFAFVGPSLPMNPENLAQLLVDKVDYIILDKMNYSWKTKNLYRKHGLDYALEENYFNTIGKTFDAVFAGKSISIIKTGKNN
ncbi:MAG TPA: radical SAM protein [Candidatus Marinimicrobia bacterium]|nr:radical SAM protein [Candidatus Neomarinimicrobiota bacterium]